MASAFGGTVTGGIQDISALLPLLGTEQCEEHVGSALVGGFLYAAVAPLSLFGSLGIARAGGKALMACIRYRTFMGARLLRDAGFAPVGKALSQIMWDGERHVAEKSLTEMLEKLHITDMEKLSVEEHRKDWNLRLLCCLLPVAVASTMPYIYFIRNDHTDPKYARWLYPLMRTIGGCLTATMVQFIIQTRLMEIIKNRLVFLRLDTIAKGQGGNIDLPEWWDAKKSSEVALCRLFAPKSPDVPEAEGLWKVLRHNVMVKDEPRRSDPLPTAGAQAQSNVSQQENGDPEAGTLAIPNTLDVKEIYRPFTTPSYFHCMYIFLIICGVVLSIGGYIGSFTIVTNDGKANANSKGSLIWLGAEIALSLLRMLIWSLNPSFDEHTNLTFKLQLEKSNPLPTCNKFSEELEANGVIPLARSREFLGQITSFVGLLEPFKSDGDGVALYYTMSVQRGPVKPEWMSAKQQRVLYITIYEYTENISRSFTLVYLPSSKQAKTCYNSTIEVQDSGDSDNVKGGSEDDVGRLCARLHGKVSKGSNHITSNKSFIKKLDEHCASIFHKLNNRAMQDDLHTEIKRTWALAEVTEPPKEQAEPGVGSDSPPLADELAYLREGELERSKQNFCSMRRMWMDAHIAFLQKQKYTHPVGTPEHTAAKYLMLYEWQFLERMLLHESRKLETILLLSSEAMIKRLKQRPNDRILDAMRKEQVSKATRRVKDEQVHANRRLEQFNEEVQSWITDYWGLAESALEACTRMISDPIQQLWGQIIADMKRDKHPPAPSEYNSFLKKTLDPLVSTTDRKDKRSKFEEAEQANAAQRDAMIRQLHEDIQTMGKWLELFISAV
ncbi:hypothetical protein EYR40_004633 [Pleurotus pulmonarius]|nr:hypothetical protein EYR38_001874 [Pleurotus pulmonarius]KAF4605843.1 hypothetical protein EYR40_004633 [Pleurotus pulmonarius]